MIGSVGIRVRPSGTTAGTTWIGIRPGGYGGWLTVLPAISILYRRSDLLLLSIPKASAGGIAEHLVVDQTVVHQPQALLEHGACLCEYRLYILRSMELQLFHVSVLLLQSVAYLQERLVERVIIQGAAKLQRLMDVLFETQPCLVGHGLSGICQARHLLDADLGKLHQPVHFLLRVIACLQAEVFRPHFQRIQRFVGQVILGRVDRCTAPEQQTCDHKD